MHKDITMEDALSALQECSRVYLAVDEPQGRIRLEDGSYGVFSPDEDPIMAAMEFLTLQNIHFSRDPEELAEADGAVVVLTEGWRSSKTLQREIARIRRARLSMFALNPTTMELKSA